MKSIGFFACSNGFGHYKRISEIASLLSNDFDITIYATWFQMYNLGGVKNCRHVQQHTHNIRWDQTLSESKIDYKSYRGCLEDHKKDLRRHDYIISDNIIGILDYRPDAIIIGSFLWKDVLYNKFGDNRISDIDRTLLREYVPPIITNKYVETGTLKEYTNKIQFGFGCKSKPYKQFKIDETSFEPQTSPKGKRFRLSEVSRGDDSWIYRFKYLDEDGFFLVETKYNKSKVIKNNEL